MSTAAVTLADDSTTIRLAGQTTSQTTGRDAGQDAGAGDEPAPEQVYVIPAGARSLGDRHIRSDPPLPEELTNAIGEMLDHLEDAKRELPALIDAATVTFDGPVALAVAAIEIGGPLDGPMFTLSRDAAEDVFRTVVTEPRQDRRHNPGLPAELVDVIVGGCCALVGVLRGLHLTGVEVRA